MKLHLIGLVCLVLCLGNNVLSKSIRHKYPGQEKYGLEYMKKLEVGKIIIDTDVGSDDAVAISFALEHIRKTQESEVIAITCTHGNTNVHNVQNNTLRLLKVLNRLDIPVFGGMDRSILTTPPVGDYFGKDGMNDVPMVDPPSMSLIQPEHAVQALIKLVKENPGEITLIGIGPLSNIAMAIREDPSFRSNLKHLFLLGGAVNGYGGVGAGLEYNFSLDPEATFVVLNATDDGIEPVIMFPRDTRVNYADIEMEWRQNVLGAIETPLMAFLNKVENIEKSTATRWSSSDTTIMVSVFFPEWIREIENRHVVPVISGDFRGGLVVDRGNALRRYKNAIIISNVDNEMYRNLLLKTFA